MSAELAELRRKLEALCDREAIRDVLTGIARGVDRFDSTLLAACVAPDAKLDMGGAEPLTGAAFAAMKAPETPPKGRMHIVSNERIVLDGDKAWSETHVLSCQAVDAGGALQTRIRAGRYLDRFAKRGGAWKLVERTFIDEWGRVDAVDEAAAQGAHRGAPSPRDLLYTMFGEGASR